VPVLLDYSGLIDSIVVYLKSVVKEFRNIRRIMVKLIDNKYLTQLEHNRGITKNKKKFHSETKNSHRTITVLRVSNDFGKGKQTD
jgi:hypothetical protein